MTAKIACKYCKFVDLEALRDWENGERTPYCTYPGHRELDEGGDCQSGRESLDITLDSAGSSVRNAQSGLERDASVPVLVVPDGTAEWEATKNRVLSRVINNTEFMVDLNMGHYCHISGCVAVRNFPAVYKCVALGDIRKLTNRSGNRYEAHDCVRVLGRRFV